MAVQLEFLKNVPYFAGLGTAELEAIKRRVFEKSFERGEIIQLEGEASGKLFFVFSGVVKVFKTSAAGKEQILTIVRPGDTFNDVPVLDGGPNPASAQAMGPVVVYGLSQNDVGDIRREYPRVAGNIIKGLAARVRQLLSLVEDLSFKHVIGRVAKILLEQARDGTGPKPRLTQQEMAAMAGTTREVVGRSLKTLEEERVIRLDHHRIIVTDKKGLEGLIEAY